jgi:hypothetical protein
MAMNVGCVLLDFGDFIENSTPIGTNYASV